LQQAGQAAFPLLARPLLINHQQLAPPQAIDEYVPIRIPITKANEKPCSTSPPKTNNARKL